MSLNKVLLIGNAGRDPEIRHLESGTMNATFSLATTERYRDRSTGEMKEQTEWHNIVCWRNLAEIAEKYVKKGTQLFIEGRIRTRSYNDKDGNTKYMTEILADNMQLLGRTSSPTSPSSREDGSSPGRISSNSSRTGSSPSSLRGTMPPHRQPPPQTPSAAPRRGTTSRSRTLS